MTIIMQITAAHAQKRCCFMGVTPLKTLESPGIIAERERIVAVKTDAELRFQTFFCTGRGRAIRLFERRAELAHALISHRLSNLLDGHPGCADQLPGALEALLNQEAMNGNSVGTAKVFL